MQNVSKSWNSFHKIHNFLFLYKNDPRFEWVSECVTGCFLNANYFMARTNDIQRNDDVHFVLSNTLNLISIVLVYWNNSQWVDMSLHSGTLSWFRAKLSLLLFLKAVCLVEKQQIPIL
jgi:hypothetical protein